MGHLTFIWVISKPGSLLCQPFQTVDYKFLIPLHILPGTWLCSHCTDLSFRVWKENHSWFQRNCRMKSRYGREMYPLMKNLLTVSVIENNEDETWAGVQSCVSGNPRYTRLRWTLRFLLYRRPGKCAFVLFCFWAGGRRAHVQACPLPQQYLQDSGWDENSISPSWKFLSSSELIFIKYWRKGVCKLIAGKKASLCLTLPSTVWLIDFTELIDSYQSL